MVASSGTYFIQLDDGACQTTDTVFTLVYSSPVVDAGLDQTVCDGELITLTGSGALSFSWDNGAVDGVPFAQVVGAIFYTVTGTDANGCEDTDSVLVTVNELPFVEGLVTDATCGLPNGSVEAINASGGSSHPILTVSPVEYLDRQHCLMVWGLERILSRSKIQRMLLFYKCGGQFHRHFTTHTCIKRAV